MAISKTELQRLAEQRLLEAKELLDAGAYGLAYYVAGYVVEIGLKACIANLFKSEEFPDRKFADKCYIHDLEKLMEHSQLLSRFMADAAVDPLLEGAWSIVVLWNEATRYENKSEAAARELYDAIADPSHGVFQWIKRVW